MMNYEALHNIYEQRKNHKLDEWVQFCKIFTDANNIPLPWLITGEDASGKSQVHSDWTKMFVKAGADVLKAIRSGHDETSKMIALNIPKVVKLGNGIAPEPIRFVPEDSSEEFIDNVKKQMLEADNEVSRKLGFRVNKNDCKEDTNVDDSTCPVTINFDGADLLKAIRASNYSYGIAPKPIRLVSEKNTKK